MHDCTSCKLIRKEAYPFSEVDEAAAGRLQQHRAAERGSIEAQVSEGHVELKQGLRQLLDLHERNSSINKEGIFVTWNTPSRRSS